MARMINFLRFYVTVQYYDEKLANNRKAEFSLSLSLLLLSVSQKFLRRFWVSKGFFRQSLQFFPFFLSKE